MKKIFGYIKGNNYYKRGYFEGKKGLHSKEPWFTTENGKTSWSAFDVYFKPDDKQEFIDAMIEAGCSKEYTEF